MAALLIRNATAGDVSFLRAMLYEAAFWRSDDRHPGRPPTEALEAPELAVYIRHWGRRGDRGLVALAGAERLGAAWFRLYPESEHGYGFLDPRTPELTIAVASAHRGNGVGRALLAALLVQARLDGFPAVSLSVERDNPVVGLYRSLSFQEARRAGNASTMVARLDQSNRGGWRHPAGP